MPMYRVEVYELHSQSYEVEADSIADAILKINDGGGDIYDNGDYIEQADKYSAELNCGIDIDSANKLDDHGITLTHSGRGIPGIRNIVEC